jgi:hypothetical protein
MANGTRPVQPARMPRLADRFASRREADNELYDFGCDLVEAAADIARSAADPDAARAVPAVLGCIEAALQELSGACAALQRANAESTERPSDARALAVVDRLERGYANLSVALRDARDASRAARSLAARRLGASGGRGRRPN